MSATLQESETIEQEVKEVKAVIVEDEPADKKLVEDKLAKAGVSTVSFGTLTNYKEILKATEDAVIVSLDLNVDGVNQKSLDLAKVLVRDDPFRGIFIFTERPDDIKNSPVNFIVAKRTRAQELYEVTSFNILIHDTTLSLLR